MKGELDHGFDDTQTSVMLFKTLSASSVINVNFVSLHIFERAPGIALVIGRKMLAVDDQCVLLEAFLLPMVEFGFIFDVFQSKVGGSHD